MENSLQLLNERQAARMLAVSCAALRRWRRERRGPEFVRCGRCVRYDIRTLERFVNENRSTRVKKIAADPESAARREVRDGHATAHHS